ncbi:MAG: FkbM family methyltransferase [Spirochaetes bacterium]|nr:FkbM family methyltransferase [Spirochaetota bacterium]
MKLTPSDFFPPLFARGWRKLFRGPVATGPVDRRKIHPFDAVPAGLEPKLILDVGANQGDVSIAAAKSYPGARIVCFEPVSATYRRLAERMAPYRDRCELHALALSDREGEAEIHLTTAHGANSLEAQAEFHKKINPKVRELSTETIRLATLDSIRPQLPPGGIDLIKIDVEGHEMKVLRGGERTFRDSVDTLLIEVSLQRDASWEAQAFLEMFQLLSGWGFRLVNLYDVYHATAEQHFGSMLVTQFDCVWRHKRHLS